MRGRFAKIPYGVVAGGKFPLVVQVQLVRAKAIKRVKGEVEFFGQPTKSNRSRQRLALSRFRPPRSIAPEGPGGHRRRAAFVQRGAGCRISPRRPGSGRRPWRPVRAGK